MMSVRAIYNRDPDNTPIWFVKGAPEVLLQQCFLYQTQDGKQSLTPKLRKNYIGAYYKIKQHDQWNTFKFYRIP